MSVVDEVRARLDVVEVVGDYVELKRSGRSHKGRCPFHDERTPSFVVFPDSGNWRCFGACAVGGDVFDFIMRVENVDFRGALEILARRTGVPLEPPSPAAAERKDKRDRLREALADAAAHYHRQLSDAPGGGAARRYLEAREMGAKPVVDFELGWAPEGWTVTRDALRAAGHSDEDLLAAGLLRQGDSGRAYDTFRGRLMIPIRDPRGRVIGFGARTLDPEGVPKYINSPQSELFDKSRVLYGIDRAARAMRQSGRAVVVEGYTDVIRAHVAGFEDVVASLGTALTESHITGLKRYAKTIVLALDADAAGRAATIRGLDVAREASAGDVVPIPTARGWVRYEHSLDVELRVATLPPGKDPDDVVRADPTQWAALIDGAQPVMDYLFAALTADLVLEDAHGKTEAADRLMPIIAGVPDPVARSAWVARLADLIHIDERALAARLVGADSGRPKRRPVAARPDEAPPPWAEAPPPDRPAQPPRDLATWLLGHLILEPRRLRALTEALRADGQPALGTDDMERVTDRDLLAAVRHASRGVPPPDAPPEHNLADPPEHLAAYVATLRARAADEPPLDESSRLAALRVAVLMLRERALKRRLEGLRFLFGEATPEERKAQDGHVRATTDELLALQRLLRPDANRDFGKTDGALGRR